MEESPLVSVIIPTYNDGPLVCQAIDSALQQSYRRTEVIVVDDGSTLDIEPMLRDKYPERVIYLRQSNKGAGSARNTGIRHASGKYIQFLDADDLLDPNKISIQVGLLQGAAGMALSYCDYVYCDLDDLSVRYEHRYMSPILDADHPFEDLLLRWELGLTIPIHCFLFDAVFFKEHGIAFDEKLPTNEDWDCWMDIFALQPQVFFVDRILAYYRLRKNSRCSNRLTLRQGHLLAIKKQLRKHRNNPDLVEKLGTRKMRIKSNYQAEGPAMRVIGNCPPVVERLYRRFFPWRLQRMLD